MSAYPRASWTVLAVARLPETWVPGRRSQPDPHQVPTSRLGSEVTEVVTMILGMPSGTTSDLMRHVAEKGQRLGRARVRRAGSPWSRGSPASEVGAL